MALPGILINRQSRVPLHRQLESALRDAILRGDLSPGERLLSSRELQTHLGLSRNSILDALGQLHAEGYLVTERGVGTFVSEHVQQAQTALSIHPEAASIPSENVQLHMSVAELAANLQQTFPFRPGMPALDLFPAEQFRRGFSASAWTTDILDYDRPFGHMPLRAAIAQRLRQTRGIVCSEDDVIISGGAQQAFTLCAQVLIDKGDTAILEDPGYPNIRATFLANQARVVGAPVDESGIVVSFFAHLRAKVACITPSHQYPTGAILSLERRFALLDWAARHGAWIIEDDYDSEFNYTKRPQPALQGLGGGGRVIYVGTFSKVLSPALRVAYIVVPKSLRAAFEAAQRVTGAAPSTILQAAVAKFIEMGGLARHIAKVRSVYDERRQFVTAELARLAGSIFHVRDSRAGLHFVAELPESIQDTVLSERASQKGLVLPALSSHYFENPPRNGVIIGYAATPIPQAREAIGALVSLL